MNKNDGCVLFRWCLTTWKLRIKCWNFVEHYNFLCHEFKHSCCHGCWLLLTISITSKFIRMWLISVIMLVIRLGIDYNSDCNNC